MALVASVVFFVIRAGLGLDRHTGKRDWPPRCSVQAFGASIFPYSSHLLFFGKICFLKVGLTS
jgi:hypothetical protein